MKLDPPRFHANLPTNGYAAQSTEADLADLRAALQKSRLPASESDAVLEGYAAARQKFQQFVTQVSRWQSHTSDWIDGRYQDSPVERPQLSSLEIPLGMPAEFSDYLRASLAWRNGLTNEARAMWKALLEQPREERHYRSTWAAYMLGLTSDTDKPEESLKYFALTRTLASGGFPDSLGLAAATIGWEARLNLTQLKFEPAIELYLQQYAAGEKSAVSSLRLTAAAALTNGVAALVPLAKNPRTQKVITAYISSRWMSAYIEPGVARARARDWLEAIAKAGSRNVEWAEQFALVAYQYEDFDLAQRWVNLAQHSPAAEWIQAKLHLRAGKTSEAEALLAQLATLLPLQPRDTNDLDSLSFSQCLTMHAEDTTSPKPSAARQVRGELGILRLAHGEFQQSLDDLLRAEWLIDASYVAERVLTIEELKSYVDANWPDLGTSTELSADPDAEARQTIRELLGRRLCRLNRGTEAGPYFPARLQKPHAALMRLLTEAWEESRPAAARAESFFEAARIVESNGAELLGTAVSPDDGCVSYWSGEDLSPHYRLTNEVSTLMRPTAEETQRYATHKPEPDLRGHYYYQAASLAWEAAKLMPDNSEATAEVLWTAGSWVKYRNPKFADLFYKTLVHRCRKTKLGAAADAMHWFPRLDERGNIIPHPVRARPVLEMSSPNLNGAGQENLSDDSGPAPPQ